MIKAEKNEEEEEEEEEEEKKKKKKKRDLEFFLFDKFTIQQNRTTADVSAWQMFTLRKSQEAQYVTISYQITKSSIINLSKTIFSTVIWID